MMTTFSSLTRSTISSWERTKIDVRKEIEKRHANNYNASDISI